MTKQSDDIGGGFKFLVGDVNWKDYGGKWYKPVAGTTRYHIIEFTNMDEACGRDNDGCPPYVVELSEVDTDNDQLEDAMRCCGFDDAEYQRDSPAAAEALHSYGAKSPLWESGATGNAFKALAAAKRESRALMRDASAYESAMDRPVNAIGSTAREYGSGDIQSAILRGVSEGDPKAELMLRLGMGRK